MRMAVWTSDQLQKGIMIDYLYLKTHTLRTENRVSHEVCLAYDGSKCLEANGPISFRLTVHCPDKPFALDSLPGVATGLPRLICKVWFILSQFIP